MIIDDEPSVLEIFSEKFTEAGYKVFCAESGEEAIQIASQENIKVFFLDLKLPGISGLELCKQLKKTDATCCVYAVTGYSSIYDAEACRQVGFDDYFSKPFHTELLMKTALNAFKQLEGYGLSNELSSLLKDPNNEEKS